jgi:hypothetical protein
MMNKAQIILMTLTAATAAWMLFDAGRWERRVPEETNISDGWWQDETANAERNTGEMQVEIMQEK